MSVSFGECPGLLVGVAVSLPDAEPVERGNTLQAQDALPSRACRPGIYILQKNNIYRVERGNTLQAAGYITFARMPSEIQEIKKPAFDRSTRAIEQQTRQ